MSLERVSQFVQEHGRVLRHAAATAVIGGGALISQEAHSRDSQPGPRVKIQSIYSPEYLAHMPSEEVFKRVVSFNEKYQVEELDIQTAMQQAIPLWTRQYLETAFPEMGPEEMREKIAYYSAHSSFHKFSDPRILGAVYKDESGQSFKIDFNKHAPSNSVRNIVDHHYVSGLMRLRNTYEHEMGHVTSETRDPSHLKTMFSVDEWHNPWLQGFSIHAEVKTEKGLERRRYLSTLDEVTNDIKVCRINQKARLPYEMEYSETTWFWEFIESIGISVDELSADHTHSDLEGFAQKLSVISDKNRGAKQFRTSAEMLENGVDILHQIEDALNGYDTIISVYFPNPTPTNKHYSYLCK